jgi:hypothetical protein
MMRGSLSRCAGVAMATQQLQQQSRRFAWQAVLTKFRDPATGQLKYRDWDEIMAGARDPMKGNQTLLDRYDEEERHTKRTTVKKELKARIYYNRKMKQIDDLLSYIKFMKEHPDDFAMGKPKKY